MVGLLARKGDPASSPAAPTDDVPPTAPQDIDPAAEMAGGEGESNVTPEEQAQYEQFVKNAFSLIYDEKTLPGVIENLKGDGDPIDGLAHTAAVITMQVAQSAEKSGVPVSDDVLMHGGIAILEDLAMLAEKAGVHSFGDEDLEAATLRAMDIGRELLAGAGRVDKGALKQEFATMIEADKAGQLGEVIPGLKAAAPPSRGGKTPAKQEEMA